MIKKYVINSEKYKLPEFYLKSLLKQKERKEKMEKIKEQRDIIKKKTKEEKESLKNKPSSHEIEYKNYIEREIEYVFANTEIKAE